MNKQRRKNLDNIYNELESIKEKCEIEICDIKARISILFEGMEELKERLENERENEDETYNNMPESLQGGERGQAMEEAVSEMDSAMEKLDEIVAQHDELIDSLDSIDESISEVLGYIDNAKGMQ